MGIVLLGIAAGKKLDSLVRLGFADGVARYHDRAFLRLVAWFTADAHKDNNADARNLRKTCRALRVFVLYGPVLARPARFVRFCGGVVRIFGASG